MTIFIPIKENSQRVPRKNFRLLDGMPLYKHTLYKLKDFKVFVDTDSREIAEEVEKDGRCTHVTVYKRKPNLIGDDVSVCDLIENFVAGRIQLSHFCQLHVTSPFLDVDILKSAFSKLNKGYDSVVSCNKVQSRFWRKESYGYCPVNHNPNKLEQTQDLPVFYEENSTFYIIDAVLFLKTKMRVGLNPYFYPLDFPMNLDIDTEDDWNLVKGIKL